MVQQPENIPETGLQFFGKISASISHELKNMMAIVNENAGLLEDLTLMADRGQPADPARLKKMAATVQKQVGRADQILKNMNRFAHSIDDFVAEVNFIETLELFAALTARFTAMRGIELDLQLPAKALTIRTAPFFLLNMLWHCLDSAMSAAGDQMRVVLAVTETQDCVRIHFKSPTGFTQGPPETFPSDAVNALLTVLAADLTAEPGAGEIVLGLHKSSP